MLEVLKARNKSVFLNGQTCKRGWIGGLILGLNAEVLWSHRFRNALRPLGGYTGVIYMFRGMSEKETRPVLRQLAGENH